MDKLDPNLLPKWRPVILNPLRLFWLLRSPDLFAVVSIRFFFPTVSTAKVFVGISLWLVLRLCSVIMVCALSFLGLYTAHIPSSITGTACVYNRKFAQLNVLLSFKLTTVITQGVR